jgi:hypothetical protein
MPDREDAEPEAGEADDQAQPETDSPPIKLIEIDVHPIRRDQVKCEGIKPADAASQRDSEI